MEYLFFVIPICLLILYIIVIFNKLIMARVHYREASSGVCVHLKKRHDLTPKLTDLVKQYASHEKGTLDQVTHARTQARAANQHLTAQTENAERQLSSALASINALAEAYPDLKADNLYIKLHDELSEIEELIAQSRRFYNGCIREYNILVQVFPSNIIAFIFRFSRQPFFEFNMSDS